MGRLYASTKKSKARKPTMERISWNSIARTSLHIYQSKLYDKMSLHSSRACMYDWDYNQLLIVSHDYTKL